MSCLFLLIEYRTIEGLFGSYIADHFNDIVTILTIIGLGFALLGGYRWKNNKSWLEEEQKKQNARFEYLNSHLQSSTRNKKHKNDGYQGNFKKKTRWYPTGWTFNEKTQLWEPPDYAKRESDRKWRWDPDKKIWVDQEKEERLAKYREYHKDRPPTFEEWKAAREKENQDKA